MQELLINVGQKKALKVQLLSVENRGFSPSNVVIEQALAIDTTRQHWLLVDIRRGSRLSKVAQISLSLATSASSGSCSVPRPDVTHNSSSQYGKNAEPTYRKRRHPTNTQNVYIFSGKVGVAVGFCGPNIQLYGHTPAKRRRGISVSRD